MDRVEQTVEVVKFGTEAGFRSWMGAQARMGWRVVSTAVLRGAGHWPSEPVTLLVVLERPHVEVVQVDHSGRHPAGGGSLIPPRRADETEVIRERPGGRIVRRRRKTVKA